MKSASDMLIAIQTPYEVRICASSPELGIEYNKLLLVSAVDHHQTMQKTLLSLFKK
jgi:hypothetical protein